ncbi:unnamed protein product [Phytophthora fragariaefolia]|uniref:Unnamed protein product n=1 Tax=Phytophthora fragariaefolia TaxID=1490495 RepID=A0A9W6TXA8_9STRA|nr:unnamed protein product [Phytophthora fragariaefolia]
MQNVHLQQYGFIRLDSELRMTMEELKVRVNANSNDADTVFTAVNRNVNFSLDPQVCGSGDIIDAEDMYRGPPSNASEEILNSYDSKAVTAGEHKKRKVEQAKGGAPVHFVCIELVANGFLRHMVRRIIGTLRPISEGTQPPSRMQQVLEGAVQPGPSAPTKALWLHRTWLTQEEYDADCAGL